VCYDVGMPWWAAKNGWRMRAGGIINYELFGPRNFYDVVRDVLAEPRENMDPRGLAALFNMTRFRDEWKFYLESLGR